MKLLKDLQAEYIKDLEVIKQLVDEFGDYSEYEKEYDEFFNGEYLNQVINESSAGSGHLAGAGPIDYNEGKVLYIWIRVNRPAFILEVGTAAGCSTVIMAKALQMNGFLAGYIDTADISTDNYEAGISLFRKYVDGGFIETKFGVDGVDYIRDNWDIHYDMIFIDADHAQKFCYDIAGALLKTFPTTPIFYHEYALTNLAST
jgi:predicted O-methyltransferase YrrM